MKYWASEPIDDLVLKVKVMMCIFIVDLLNVHYLVHFTEWLCDIYD